MAGPVPTKNPSRLGPARKPFQPAIGTDFGRVEEVEAKTRGFITRLGALAIVTALAVTGGYGLMTENYTTVIAVWAAVGPFIGAVVAYYYGPQRNDTG